MQDPYCKAKYQDFTRPSAGTLVGSGVRAEGFVVYFVLLRGFGGCGYSLASLSGACSSNILKTGGFGLESKTHIMLSDGDKSALRWLWHGMHL